MDSFELQKKQAIDIMNKIQEMDANHDAEMKKIRNENEKLACQAIHLERALLAQTEQLITRSAKIDFSKGMINVSEQLGSMFHISIQKSYPQLKSFPRVAITINQNEKFGDYQCNNAMSIFGLLKALGLKTSPKQIADNIVKNLSQSDIIESCTVSGPGFINIRLSQNFLKRAALDLLIHGVHHFHSDKDCPRVVIDYSSPNIAKEMHVGHLRSTIIGDCLANMFEFFGHDVLRLNHVGDWGTQFGMLIAHLTDEFPDYKTQSPPISDLQTFYKQSKKRFDNDAEFKKRAYESVVKLQSGDPDFIKAWQLICEVSRQEFKLIYDRLKIGNLIERGESFYRDSMPAAVEMMDKQGIVVVEDGRKLVFPKGCQTPLTIVKSDGGFTYDTSDMACVRQRIFDEKGGILVYVTDSGQGTHFEAIFSVAKDMGWYDPNKTRIQHVGHGVVLGEDRKKFKTRSGETIRLVELLDEGLKRCEEKLIAKGRDKELSEDEFKAAKQAVAYGCIKYADLSHNRINDYVFSFDKMLDDKGNTAAYLLYAYTRIKSISRTAQVSKQDLISTANYFYETGNFPIDHPKEFKVVKYLIRFPEVLQRVFVTLEPHILCDYLYELSSVFTEFYDNCYCVEKDRKTGDIVKIHKHRLLLCEATLAVISQCFKILGLTPVSKM